jgi:hypothetical protein
MLPASDRSHVIVEGDRIVLIGEKDGTPMRWSFNDITPHRFTWIGESERTDGIWTREAEFELRRIR